MENEALLSGTQLLSLLQVIIPVSLYVSVELVKLGQVYFINQDIEMFYEPAANFSICRATTINEDLGQIQYVFSDKTGTLTENKMVLKRFTVLGSDYAVPDGKYRVKCFFYNKFNCSCDCVLYFFHLLSLLFWLFCRYFLEHCFQEPNDTMP